MALAAPARDLSAAIPLVEAIIGRPLRLAEQAIDVIRLDQALEQAKDELEAEIRAEMLRATAAWKSGAAVRPAVRVTPEMLAILERLREIGRQEAELELERLGYVGIRRRDYAAEPAPTGRDVDGYVARNLGGITTRIEDELVTVDLGGASHAAIAQALLRVPGARDLASRVISTAMIDGLAETWDRNADLVACWEYTAVLDAGTCHRCAPLDGKRYQSLEELYRDLPNFGPNPHCLGGGRCRCRAVPCPTSEAPQLAPEPDPVETLDPDLPGWRRELGEIRARLAPLDVVKAGRGLSQRERLSKMADADLVDLRGGDLLTGTSVSQIVPGRAMAALEQDVLRAGEIIDRELDDRIFDEVAGRQTAIGEAKQRVEPLRARYTEAEELYRSTIRTYDAEERDLRDRLREGFLAQGIEPTEAFRLAQTHDELLGLKAHHTTRLLELQREKQAALELVSAERKAIAALEDEIATVQRQGLRELLDEHRGIGPAGEQAWTFTTKGARGAAKMILEQAAAFLPRDWIIRGRLNAIKPRFTKNGRGYHRGGMSESDLVVSGGRRSKIGDDPDGFATAIHELGHHLEYVDPRIRALEWAFYQRRTRSVGYGEQEREYAFPRGAGYGRHEAYRKDGFVESYMGKTYGNGPRSSHELVSMGLESVWTGSYELDPEMRRFILGLLATV